jgi:hypothetical protein
VLLDSSWRVERVGSPVKSRATLVFQLLLSKQVALHKKGGTEKGTGSFK